MSHGTALVSQLYHLGPNADPVATMRDLWSVSGGPPPGGGPGLMHELDDEDIDELVDGHVRAARTALSAGVDGVECMFAYDTLVDGFMSEDRNRRSDGYGGTLENRLRLAREILDALRAALGDEPLLGVTVTASMPGYVDAVAHLAEHCDVDYFGIGNGDYDNLDLLMPTLDYEPGFGIPFARAVKQAVPAAVVLAEGRITRPETGERALAEGSCDLVGMTRAQIADPDLVRKAEAGEEVEIRECVGLNLCVARRLRKFPIACVQNPDAGFELRAVPRAATARHVVVVGGGVAGLEAARVAAEAGHRVTLLERASSLGGQVALTAGLPRQGAHRYLIDWRARRLERLGVHVELGVDADADAVLRLEPDFVVVASGSVPEQRYPGAISAVDVLRGAEAPGPVVVLDEEGHRKGAGVAETLAHAGSEVTLVGDGVAPAGSLVYTLADAPTRRRLQAAGVRLVGGARVVSVEREGVVVEREGTREAIRCCVRRPCGAASAGGLAAGDLARAGTRRDDRRRRAGAGAGGGCNPERPRRGCRAVTPVPPERRSLWLEEALALPNEESCPPLQGEVRADVCIVGGGYAGLWTALRLLELEPSLEVAIVEADVCGGGASGRNGGFVLSWWAKIGTLVKLLGPEEGRRLALASARLGPRHRALLRGARDRRGLPCRRLALERDLAGAGGRLGGDGLGGGVSRREPVPPARARGGGAAVGISCAASRRLRGDRRFGAACAPGARSAPRRPRAAVCASSRARR